MSSGGPQARSLTDAALGFLGAAGGVFAWFAAVFPMAAAVLGGRPAPAAWLAVAGCFLVVFLVNVVSVPVWVDRTQAVLLVALYGVLLLLAPGYGTNGIFAVIAITSVTYAATVGVATLVAVGQALALVLAMWGAGSADLVEAAVWGGAYVGMQLFAAVMVEATRREHQARLELAAAQAALAEVSRAEERLRMARDLHDQVGHQLTALALHLEAATHQAAGGPAAESVERCRVLAKETLADVRRVVGSWRGPDGGPGAPAYDGHALADRLAGLAHSIPGLTVSVQVSDVPELSPAAFDALLRAAQEAVTNAARHSGAEVVALEVRGEDGEIVLRAVDEGRGVDQVVAGHGLVGMRERFARLGGVVTATSTPGRGFRLVARLPERS